MLPVARVGDKHICPAHGPNVIISGGPAVADGRAIARVGDKTACGAVIVKGSSVSSVKGKAVAYLGSTTTHGGVIMTGSPNHLVKP